MTAPRDSDGPTCPKCGKPVLANEKYRLSHGEVEHRDCDQIEPAAPLPAMPARTKQ